jgi:ABC-2 type transport system permease protein/lipopolysaccharide transport system permease protein
VISAGVLAVIMAVTTTMPKPTIVWVPYILLVQVAATVGIVLFLAITIVYLRDLGQALPLVLQLGLFATPVAYAATTLIERAGTWYAALNPLVGVIESYRACVVGGTAPPWDLMVPSTIGAIVWLVVGAFTFKRYENGIADVA